MPIFPKNRILVVDDTPQNIELLGVLLRRERWEVMAATSGEKALAMVERKPPDLILLDVMMPAMDGYEVCRRLKANPVTEKIPVIFLTAKNEREDMLEGFKGGGVDYITKPFDAQELLARVRTHLQLVDHQKALARYHRLADRFVLGTTTNKNGIIMEASEAFAQRVGFQREELIGRSHNIIRHPDMSQEFFASLWSTIERGEPWRGEIKNLTKSGEVFWADTYIEPIIDIDGAILGYEAVRIDITDKKRIEELAITDRLTGVYNRLRLDEALNHEIARAKRYYHPLSLVMIDIDYFKKINDTYGHQAGDEVLKKVAFLIKTSLRDSDVVGRWGGEEFMVLLPETSLEAALELSERLRQRIFEADFGEIGHRSCSFGVATLREEESVTQLVARADEALYRAKHNGRNRVES
ncbi:MAG: diguanylate cyclase [Campylobacterales bacterium]